MENEEFEINLDERPRILDLMYIAMCIQHCCKDARLSAFARRMDDGHVSFFIAFRNFGYGHKLAELNDVDDLRKVMTFISDSAVEDVMISNNEISLDSDESIDEYNRKIHDTIERMICEAKLMKGEVR